jgi:hypothetical protein
MTRFPIAGALALLGLTACGPKIVNLTAEPANAVLYKVGARASDTTRIAVGTALMPLLTPTQRVMAWAPGYLPVTRDVTAVDAASKKPVLLQLKDRVVKVVISPATAQATLDGTERLDPRATNTVLVREGTQRTVEVKSNGFKTVTRTYVNRSGQTLPPEADDIVLNQRAVLVRVSPGGTQIDINGVKYGQDFAEVAVAENSCTTVKASRPGYLSKEQQYCVREGLQALPLQDQLTLVDRAFEVRPEPETAEMWVAGRRVGVGPQQVVVQKDECVEVRAEAPAYIPWRKEYCLLNNGTPLPVEGELAKLNADGSWAMSTASDQANVNFNVSVNPKRTEDEAWKILSQIVTNLFDVLELSDKETGYMRTGWNVTRVENCCTIRTRVIVKQADSSPLRYTVKLVSENSYVAKNAQEDELFKPWPRLLVRYKDIINEMQERLK